MIIPSQVKRVVLSVALLLITLFVVSSSNAQPTAKGSKGISVADTQKVLTCGNWFWLGRAFQVTGQWKQSRDTLEYYIQHCANDTGSFHAFWDLYVAAKNASSDSTGMLKLREFLKAVLYLNKWDQNYFCECVWTIAQTYNTTNEGLAVMRYLIQSNRCSGNRDEYIGYYNDARGLQAENYLNSGLDTSKVHLDTTLPSLHALGLDSLLNLASVGAESAGPHAIFNVHASGNPFSVTTEVLFDLSNTAYVRFGVYDELGRNVQGEETGHVYDPGRHRFAVNGKSLANGIYYARLSTPTGEVLTVKLIKKE